MDSANGLNVLEDYNMDRKRTTLKTPFINMTLGEFVIRETIQHYMEDEGAYPSIISLSYKLYNWVKPLLSPQDYYWGVKIITASQEEPIKVIS